MNDNSTKCSQTNSSISNKDSTDLNSEFFSYNEDPKSSKKKAFDSYSEKDSKLETSIYRKKTSGPYEKITDDLDYSKKEFFAFNDDANGVKEQEAEFDEDSNMESLVNGGKKKSLEDCYSSVSFESLDWLEEEFMNFEIDLE